MRTRRGIELPITVTEMSKVTPYLSRVQDNRTSCGSPNSNCGAGILWINCFFNGKRDMEIASLLHEKQ
jgi:hypothetical protein